MPKLKPTEQAEPVGKHFHAWPDELYCSFCGELIEPERQDENPCHLCGEWRFLCTGWKKVKRVGIWGR